MCLLWDVAVKSLTTTSQRNVAPPSKPIQHVQLPNEGTLDSCAVGGKGIGQIYCGFAHHNTGVLEVKK